MAARGATSTTNAWDLLVVGGGTAGIVTSTTAASLGARVLLVERERTGGDCLWTGCVPSKALLAAAAAAAGVRASRDGGRLGIHADGLEVDFEQVRAHVRAAIDDIEPDDSPETLEKAGVHVRHGDLRFTSRSTATVDGETVEFWQAAVCTGSDPAELRLPRMADAEPLTTETVWDLETLPHEMTVLGGGPVGCELSQAFARLGVDVTLVEQESRLLPREDPAASEAVARALEHDGVQVLLDATPKAVIPKSDGAGALEVRTKDGSHDVVAHDRLLVATGRRARTDGLGLETAGVHLDDDGNVVVDRRMRTSNPRFWAAGDVCGPPHYTHTAGVDGNVVALNAVLGIRRSRDVVVPRVTFTSPEVGAVGVGVEEAEQDKAYAVLRTPHADVDRAVTEAETAGSTTLVVDKRGRLVGASVVGPRAGETLGELTLAVKRKLRTADLATTTHAYPTYSDAAWNTAIGDYRQRIGSAVRARGVGVLGHARRWWVTRRQG